MRKAQKGDANAFLELFTMYEEDLYRMAFVYVKNKDDALDVVQEVAYKSFKNLATLKNPEYVKTWLIKITINCAISLLNKNKKVVPLKPDYEQFIGEEEEDLPLTITLQDLISNLKEDEKSVVLLRFYQNFTFQEIAQVLGIPLGTAKSILYRALKKLKKEWKGDAVNEQ